MNEPATMTIFNGGSRGRAIIFVTPGKDHPEVREWFEEIMDGDEIFSSRPRMLTVRFEAGAAEVPENLGRYLIACQLAYRRPVEIQMPPSVAEESPAAPQPRPKPIAVGRPIGEFARLSAAGMIGP